MEQCLSLQSLNQERMKPVGDFFLVGVSALSFCQFSDSDTLGRTSPIQSSMSVHHRCVVLCFVNICQKGRFGAAALACGSSMKTGRCNHFKFRWSVMASLGVFSSYSAVAQTEFDWCQPTRSFERHVQTERIGGT